MDLPSKGRLTSWDSGSEGLCHGTHAKPSPVVHRNNANSLLEAAAYSRGTQVCEPPTLILHEGRRSLCPKSISE